MLDRRKFLCTSTAGAAAVALGGCSDNSAVYQKTVSEMRRPLPPSPDARALVRYATLAANGHNTQPWKFQIQKNGIEILPDFTRRTPAVDPDDHHLFASLGCAAENLSLAAKARGMAGEVQFEPTGDGGARVDLRPAPRHETDLFAAIPLRQCSRAPYDGRTVPPGVLDRLTAAANKYGVEAVFATDSKGTEKILDLVVEGNSRQVDDLAFVAELKDWLRFNPEAAVASRDGLYSASSGNPTLPSWFGAVFFDLFFTKASENEKYAEQIRSSAGIVTFIAKHNDKAGWFNAGRACQRFALRATADGLKHAFINQAVEVPEVRRELQSLLGIGDHRPNLVVRFGYGPVMPKSLRRPVTDVIV